MSTASSAQSPAPSARPARLPPSGPGNISGKMVRIVARHMARQFAPFWRTWKRADRAHPLISAQQNALPPPTERSQSLAFRAQRRGPPPAARGPHCFELQLRPCVLRHLGLTGPFLIFLLPNPPP